MAILPDGRILHTERFGDIFLTDPATGFTERVNTIDVYTDAREDGLQTISIDPNFAENNWVYLVYSPALDTPEGEAPTYLPEGEDESYWDQWKGVNRLSRVQWTGSALDMESEQIILEVEVQRGQCCHLGSDVAFDAEGNLYFSTGDNTPAGAEGAEGYAPINDGEAVNPGQDARRSAGNTNDLRGKILRIRVQEDGSYTIPEGNLFPEGMEGTRPEIFVMGVRNPFRMNFDVATNTLSWGDYGPDAQEAHPDRGPMGYVEWTAVRPDEGFNAGWPFCHGNNQPYVEWDYVNLLPLGAFDCDAPINTSRWNTGLTELPPAQEPTIYYGDNPGDQPHDEFVTFSESGGQGPHAGPVYHYADYEGSSVRLPEYWDGKHLFIEFMQNYLGFISLDEETLEFEGIENFLPASALEERGDSSYIQVMDAEFGPDGALYLLEFGRWPARESEGQVPNEGKGIYRIEYIGPHDG